MVSCVANICNYILYEWVNDSEIESIFIYYRNSNVRKSREQTYNHLRCLDEYSQWKREGKVISVSISPSLR